MVTAATIIFAILSNSLCCCTFKAFKFTGKPTCCSKDSSSDKTQQNCGCKKVTKKYMSSENAAAAPENITTVVEMPSCGVEHINTSTTDKTDPFLNVHSPPLYLLNLTLLI